MNRATIEQRERPRRHRDGPRDDVEEKMRDPSLQSGNTDEMQRKMKNAFDKLKKVMKKKEKELSGEELEKMRNHAKAITDAVADNADKLTSDNSAEQAEGLANIMAVVIPIAMGGVAGIVVSCAFSLIGSLLGLFNAKQGDPTAIAIIAAMEKLDLENSRAEAAGAVTALDHAKEQLKKLEELPSITRQSFTDRLKNNHIETMGKLLDKILGRYGCGCSEVFCFTKYQVVQYWILPYCHITMRGYEVYDKALEILETARQKGLSQQDYDDLKSMYSVNRDAYERMLDFLVGEGSLFGENFATFKGDGTLKMLFTVGQFTKLFNIYHKIHRRDPNSDELSSQLGSLVVGVPAKEKEMRIVLGNSDRKGWSLSGYEWHQQANPRNPFPTSYYYGSIEKVDASATQKAHIFRWQEIPGNPHTFTMSTPFAWIDPRESTEWYLSIHTPVVGSTSLRYEFNNAGSASAMMFKNKQGLVTIGDEQAVWLVHTAHRYLTAFPGHTTLFTESEDNASPWTLM